jgi:hypothetical protein
LWDCINVGNAEDGTPIVAPQKLKSVGLVERGNIPGPSLMNSAFTPPMKNKLIQLLAQLGIVATAEADDAALANFCDQALPKIALGNTAVTQLAALQPLKAAADARIVTLEADKLALANAKTGLETEKVTLSTELSNARTALVGERKERALLLVNAALADGRITAAERDAEVSTLCNAADLTAAVAALAAKKRTVKTQSVTRQLGNSLAAAEGPSGKVLSLVNARMAAAKEDYITAFANVQADPANAALFNAMKQPEKAS